MTRWHSCHRPCPPTRTRHPSLQSARPLDDHRLPSPRSPTPVPASHARPPPSAASCSAPLCATHRLIATDRTARMGMHLEMTGVNHQPLIVRFIHPMLQQRLPDPLVPPATEPTMDSLPASIVWRQITPRSDGAQNPEDRVDEPSIVLCHPTPTSRSARQMRLQQPPDPVRDVVTPIHAEQAPIVHPNCACRSRSTLPSVSGVNQECEPRSVYGLDGGSQPAMPSAMARKLNAVPCSSTKPIESCSKVASSTVMRRSQHRPGTH